MTLNAEIEKLERRWQENPLGLTFATLAEAYRKAGNPARALEVLEQGLAQHPNYVPAHIVRGRCHQDAGADHLAEAAFRQVVDLDPENVIAITTLAEIAERGGRFQEAIARLEALLEFDRSNEVAQGHIDRVRERIAGAAVAAQIQPVAEAPPAPAPEAAPEPSPVEEPIGFEPLAGLDPAELEPGPGSEYQLSSDADALAAAPELDGLLGGEYASVMALSDIPVELAAPLVEVAEAAPEPEPGAAAEPELVVTETMAEIFLRQGHRELALAVYQQLLLREPGDERLLRAVADLKPAEPEPEPEPVVEPVPVRQHAASVTGGKSVGQLLGELFDARRPSPQAAVHPPAFDEGARGDAEPTRPAGDTLSLAAVFGDEAPPAGPVSGSVAPPSEPSFDEFFAPATENGSAAELPRGPSEAGAVSGQVPEDLEQFNAWLRGLKR